ncbi:phage tail tape measure protein [Afifella sp. JA880]|uniref:phage tail tape measure protein n=1 Tax=Afifella sp. JA880 TaxID=2975280 RepID=UPI0021BAEEB6|nr:phage tail tape measure protein [Afifella sp. JA880]MCT8266765.1 phage tail tape measure protein [Afifella sp. JA880]
MADDFDFGSDELSGSAEALSATLGDLQHLADGFGRSMTSAFRQAAVEGRRFDSVLKSLALGLSRRALNAALAPIAGGLSGALTSVFGSFLGGSFLGGFAKGGVFAGGKVTPFASGGVVAAPSYFQAGSGIGLMGEAGAEAILPLRRGADGRLGVAAAGSGGQPVHVTFNVTTQDAASFRRSEAEMTAMLARAVSRGRRGL